MSKQYLVPVKDVEDARKAIARVTGVIDQGDEVVVLIVSDVPEGELVGSAPPPVAIDPLAATGGAGTSAGKAISDQPVFLGREELMEMKGQELVEAIQPHVAGLKDRGYEARVEAVFSDDPGLTIRDLAADLEVTGVFVTEDFHSDLDSDAQALAKAI